MRPVLPLLVLLGVACNRDAPPPIVDAPASLEPPVAAPDGADAPGSAAQPSAAQVADPAGKVEPPAPAALAVDEGLTKVEPLRPGPDEADRALALRLRRSLDRPLAIAGLVRSGDAWLVVYTYDENEAWWREVHRTGRAAEVREDLRKRRSQCEAIFRDAAEGAETTDEATEGVEDFDIDVEDHMDDRSCWERAVASLVPREGPLESDCAALGVARVTDAAIEPLWDLDGTCVASPAAFELADVAGAGWSQLLVQTSDVRWGSTRLGFQEAERRDRLVVLDPRPGHEPVMLEQVLEYATLVDEAWHWEGSYAHVAFTPGRHVTVVEQEWKTSDECALDPAGWAITETAGEYDTFDRCTVEWKSSRRPWDPASQRWSDAAETLRPPKRPPTRDRELPLDFGAKHGDAAAPPPAPSATPSAPAPSPAPTRASESQSASSSPASSSSSQRGP